MIIPLTSNIWHKRSAPKKYADLLNKNDALLKCFTLFIEDMYNFQLFANRKCNNVINLPYSHERDFVKVTNDL